MGERSHANILGSHINILRSNANILGRHANILRSEANILGSNANILRSEANILGSNANILGRHANILGRVLTVLLGAGKKGQLWVVRAGIGYGNVLIKRKDYGKVEAYKEGGVLCGAEASGGMVGC
jgi:hypothetical protein